MDWPYINENTPIEDVKAIHRLIWQYVVDNGEKPHTPYECDCVACEYAIQKYRNPVCRCYFCPIDWGDLGYCTEALSVFLMWYHSRSARNEAGDIMAKRLAAIIRDVKFKD